MIHIPAEFERTLSEGRQATVNLYCDMSGLLYYKAMLSGCTIVSLDMNRDIQIQRLSGLSDWEKEAMTMPIENEYITMFNPTNGFQAFLIPAVLILVLQQTLVLGVAMLAGTEHERRRSGALILGQEYGNPIVVLAGKGLAYLLVYGFTATYVLCFVPWLFHMPQLWQLPTLVAHILCHLHILLCKGQRILLPAVCVHFRSAHIHEWHIMAHIKHAGILESVCAVIPVNTRSERFCPHQYGWCIASGCKD